MTSFTDLVSHVLFQVSDEAISLSIEEPYVEGSDGATTVAFLFSLGAQCLHRFVSNSIFFKGGRGV